MFRRIARDYWPWSVPWQSEHALDVPRARFELDSGAKI